MRSFSLGYFAREVFNNIRRNIWMAVASIVTVALTMTILGVFASVTVNLNHIASSVQDQIEITCYVDDEIAGADLISLHQKIMNVDGVVSARYVSRDEALEDLRQQLQSKEHLLRGYEEENNPLQDSFIIKASTPELALRVSSIVMMFEEIEDVVDGHQYVNQILGFSYVINLFALLVMIGLALAMVFIIFNTIKSNMETRKVEIEIMRYVGATASFIRIPFLLEGLIHCFTGTAIAFLITKRLYFQADLALRDSIPLVSLAPTEPFFSILLFAFICIASILGTIGTTLAIKRYLRV